MVSEDPDEFVSGLLPIHRLRDACDLDETVTGEMPTARYHVDAHREAFEVVPLRRFPAMPLEERDDHIEEIVPPSHDVAVEVLTMVVVPPVRDDLPDLEEVDQFFERGDASLALRHRELVRHLEAGSVAASACAMVLTHEAD